MTNDERGRKGKYGKGEEEEEGAHTYCECVCSASARNMDPWDILHSVTGALERSHKNHGVVAAFSLVFP